MSLRQSIAYRFYLYQKERFPFLAHGLLIAVFSFSAVSYSRICRGMEDFIPLKVFLPGIFTTITFFLLLRISDEFKDASEDKQFRPYLPVPRGLITLKELKWIAIIVVLMQLLIQLWAFPSMLGLYALAFLYLGLMTVEFFVPNWLKKKQLIYVASHMMIIPLIDIYAAGLDWHISKAEAPHGLVFFLAVSYMNGVVIEFGRKIKPAHKEEEGVVTYSKLYGPDRAALYWIIVLLLTLALSFAASAFAGHGFWTYLVLLVLFIFCSLPAIVFMRNKREKLGKMIESASGIWTIGMYLILGGAPMIEKLISSL